MVVKFRSSLPTSRGFKKLTSAESEELIVRRLLDGIVQGRHTNRIKEFPEQTSAISETDMGSPRCGAIVPGKPKTTTFGAGGWDEKWLENSLPFGLGRPKFLGAMLLSGRVSIPKVSFILLMAEILHHLGCMKPYE